MSDGENKNLNGRIGDGADVETAPEYVLGIKANLGQFSQQLLQVFFVGLTIGMQRTVVPTLAEQEFGVPAGSFTLLMAFIISFGFVKGAMNFVAAIWYAEWSHVQDSHDPDVQARSEWLQKVRRSLPSCFCDPDDLA